MPCSLVDICQPTRCLIPVFHDQFGQFIYLNLNIIKTSLMKKKFVGIVNLPRHPQHFMEPDGLLPRSQEPTTGLYPRPDESGEYPPTLSSVFILSHRRCGFLQFFLPKLCMNFSAMHATYSTQLISSIILSS
jgi:hypothetical protein